MGRQECWTSFGSVLTRHNDLPIQCSVDGRYPTVSHHPSFHKHVLSNYYVPGTKDTKHVTWAEHKVLRVEVSAVWDIEGTGGGAED